MSRTGTFYHRAHYRGGCSHLSFHPKVSTHGDVTRDGRDLLKTACLERLGHIRDAQTEQAYRAYIGIWRRRHKLSSKLFLPLGVGVGTFIPLGEGIGTI
jgi:hypothetical protein